MTPAPATKLEWTCVACSAVLGADDDRLVLVLGRIHEEHCSDACLEETIRARRRAHLIARLRWLTRIALVAVVAGGGSYLWRHYRRPPSHAISFDAADFDWRPVAPLLAKPAAFGPAWPPTDADWAAMFAEAKWVYPLPGPRRRAPIADGRILTTESARFHSSSSYCRTADHCGVDLGGELWGEHVYAAQEGVVVALHRDGERAPGGASIRLSHLGGYVYTQYFHLAGIPRGLFPGVRVRAGDVIGLVGDTGVGRPHPHLHFALSTRPSSQLPEVYWDPTAWMADWPLHTPSHGTVAGLVPEARFDPLAHRRAASPR